MEQLFSDLIQHLTSSSPDSDEFKKFKRIIRDAQRVNYSVISKYDVDKSINGFVEKFEVHLQKKRAERLKTLYNLYLTKLPKDQEDFANSFMWFVTRLSHNPTSRSEYLDEDYLNEQSLIEELKHDSVVKEVFNAKKWKSELDTTELSQWSTAEDETDSCEEFDTDEIPDLHEERIPTTTEESQPNVSTKSPLVPSSAELGVQARKWFHDNLLPPYWKRVTWSENVSGANQQPNFRLLWESSLRAGNHLDPFGSGSIEMSERQIYREILWLLDIRKELTISKYDASSANFSVNYLVCVSHLTRSSLGVLLSSMCEIATMIHSLKLFIENCFALVDPVHSSKTYNAFASALQDVLAAFSSRLAELEQEVLVQKKGSTLLVLMDDLRPWFNNLNTVYNIFSSGVLSCAAEQGWTVSRKCAHLLHQLFRAASANHSLKHFDPIKSRLCLSLFLKSVRPYVDMLDTWTNTGSLQDSAEEFVLLRKEEASLDESFWRKCVVVREEVGEDEEEGFFLSDVIALMLVIGRSVQLLRTFTHSNFIFKDERKALFQTLLAQLSSSSAERVSSKVPREKLESGRNIFSELNFDLRTSSDSSDPLIFHWFQTTFGKDFVQIPSQKPLQIEDYVDDFLARSDVSFEHIFFDCLEQNLRGKSRVICKHLFQEFNMKHNLMGYLHSLRKYFLLEDGAMMFQFTYNLFTNIVDNRLNLDQVHLKLFLEDALAVYSPRDILKLRVELVPNAFNELNIFESIRLTYKCEWPLSILVGAESAKVMGGAFSLLLNLKNSKYQLSHLLFAELWGGEEFAAEDEEESCAWLKAALWFRFRLLYLVTNLHNYVHSQLIEVSQGVLRQVVSCGEESDFQRVLNAHQAYVESVERLSFCSANLHPLRTALLNVTSATNKFCFRWSKGLAHLSGRGLVEVKEQVQGCVEFIINFCRWTTNKRRDIYLENLIELLQSAT